MAGPMSQGAVISVIHWVACIRGIQDYESTTHPPHADILGLLRVDRSGYAPAAWLEHLSRS